MPAYKAKNGSKKAVNTAVSKNIKELYKANEMKSPGKKRSREQIIAIAFSESRGKKKKK